MTQTSERSSTDVGVEIDAQVAAGPLGYMSIVSIGQTFCSQHGIPQVTHADSGPEMRSNLFAHHGLERAHNLPRVCNDSPCSESEFRTQQAYYDRPPSVSATDPECQRHPESSGSTCPNTTPERLQAV